METKDLPGYYRHGGEVRGSRNAAPAKKIGAAAMLAATPGYADGGVVQTIKGFFGLGKKKDPLPADLNKMPPTGAGQAASQPAKEEPKKAISQYSGVSALERRMREADAYADGGMVRGPGTGTSDSVKDAVRPGTFIMPADSTKEIGASALSKMSKVPVRLSNGEYKLTPEQVHAIGVQTLEGMKDATHEPARKAYADGGTVADRVRQPALGIGAAASSATAPGPVSPKPVGAAASMATVPPVPASSANQAAAQPAKPTPSGGDDKFMPGVRNVWNESGKEIGGLVNQGRYGAALGETARAALAYVPAIADDVIGGALRSVGPSVVDAGKQFLGSGQGAPAQTTAQAQAAPMSASPLSGPGAGRGNFNPAPVNPSAPRPVAQPQAREIAPGVYRSGNSYADSPEAAVAGTAPGRLPNLQNMSAAEVLASRNGAMPGGGGSDVMGIYDRASKALAGAVDAQRQLDAYGPGASGGGAAGMGGDPGAGMRKFKEESTLDTIRQAMQQGGRGAAAAMQTWAGLQGQNAQLQAAQMREQGDTNRLNTREAGENARAGMRSAADARRDGISAALAMGKLDLERNAQGFTNRKLTREENLYSQYDAAKTPEERASIAQKIRDLSGREQSADWQVQVTPQTKNMDGSTTEGSVYRYNKRTGDVQRVDGGQAQAPSGSKFEKDKVYTDANGNKAKWDGSKFNPI